MPSPAETRPSLATQSRATKAIAGCQAETVQAPRRLEPGSVLAAIQRSCRSIAVVTLSRPAKGCPHASRHEKRVVE